jgi:uncharacterized protein YndB with AHSA1/START domain
MAIEETFEVVIARPPVEVFDHLVAVERWPEWLIASGIVGVERDAPETPIGRGATLRIRQVLAGVRSSTVAASVTAFEAGSRFTLSGKDADGVEVGIDARLTPEGLGTRLSWGLRIGLPFRLRIFEGMAAPQVRRAAALDLEAFKRRLESVAGT